LRKILASVGAAAVLFSGATACGTQDSGYDSVVQYGYYDSYHHYHYYSHPHTVRVTHKYYVTHQYQYQPHGTQHTVTVRKTTTTTRHGVVTRRSTTTTKTRRR